MMTTARDRLSRSDAVTVARIEAAVPDLAAACAVTGRFANMVRNGEHDNLEEWLSEAGGSLLASLARGLNADKHAVLAALREPWSNGQTEGQINKLKALKHQMYGRASLDLLRARLVPAAWQHVIESESDPRFHAEHQEYDPANVKAQKGSRKKIARSDIELLI